MAATTKIINLRTRFNTEFKSEKNYILPSDSFDRAILDGIFNSKDLRKIADRLDCSRQELYGLRD